MIKIDIKKSCGKKKTQTFGIIYTPGIYNEPPNLTSNYMPEASNIMIS